MKLLDVDFSKLKPSDYLEVCVVGLKRNAVDPKTGIRMGSYGHTEKDMCFGCMATMGLAEMLTGNLYREIAFGINGSLDSTRMSYVAEYSTERRAILRELEEALDFARTSCLHELQVFCLHQSGQDYDLEPWAGRWAMFTDNWEEQLPEMEAAIAEMRAAGC